MEEEIIRILKEQYKGKYDKIQLREKALLIAAQFADRIKIREATGRNDGPWVERILKVFGLGKGNPWCAAFVGKCYQMAGAKNLPPAGGAVRNWAKWKGCEVVKTPMRGDLFYLTTNIVTGAGHMGFVANVDWNKGVVHTIEGNTNLAGSRDGDGCYRRVRPISSVKFLRFIAR